MIIPNSDNTPKRLAILGATGSIGRQTLDIVAAHPELYRATVLAAGTRVDHLIELCRIHRPALAVIGRDHLLPTLRSALAPLGIATAAGPDALTDAAARPDVDMVVTATVGYSGLEPTIAAIKAGKDIALANKETLVVAGALIRQLLADSPSRIYPVDSEHSAIYQCLQGQERNRLKRLIITASGGPFRTWPTERIDTATAADALRHPNWTMGRKITIDSATMMNKAFEIIEARWLFDTQPDQITAIVHPQSVVHSMVEFVDGAIIAQLGIPDMHLPIAYALSGGHRMPLPAEGLTLSQMAQLTFEQPDPERFPCLTLAAEALHRGGTHPCAINAANEIAVEAFLQGRITFGNIYPLIRRTADLTTFVPDPTYDDYVAVNHEARRRAADMIQPI